MFARFSWHSYLALAKKSLLALGMSVLPLSSAWAHVTVHPQETPAGSFAKLTFRVPHSCDGSPTIRLRVQIPGGATSVKLMVHPLWKVEDVLLPLAGESQIKVRLLVSDFEERREQVRLKVGDP